MKSPRDKSPQLAVLWHKKKERKRVRSLEIIFADKPGGLLDPYFLKLVQINANALCPYLRVFMNSKFEVCERRDCFLLTSDSESHSS